ncbi:STM4014 family protein [Vibrio quintilis]|uniref:ATP-grasp domain-containing protein n=1 Tax=Vibrio quintilis TaxID=1117707 RepID=A0A1M7YRC5_9VIBR|nr:STM4014 family protein [Vibrio quintilis]SHO55171.1 hypothetical protein VQ7734_00890 [Vibrio quintilis]
MAVTCSRLWIYIGHPENRRKQFFTQSLPDGETLVVLSYQALLAAPCLNSYLLHQLHGYEAGQWLVKIDSPGENFAVEKALLSRAQPGQYDDLTFDKGCFRHLKFWFVAFRHLLLDLANTLQSLASSSQTRLTFLNTPEAIITMTDKLSCQRRLIDQQVPVPPLLPEMQNFEQLTDYMLTHRCRQVFVKTRYGSSASGVMALRVHPDGRRMIARTSLELGTHGRFYNSLKIRTYQDRQAIAACFDAIYSQQGYCEHWLPKPQLAGLGFDLRILVIDGRAAHHVTRCSRSPMTNLHLGNQRGDILQHPQGEMWLMQARQVAEQAAAAIPGGRCIGADVICGKSGLPANSASGSDSSEIQARVLELNAFGDLLPGIEFDGMDSCQAQIKALLCG